MARKIIPLTEQLKHAIDASEMTRYRICKEAGLSEATMSRFMNGRGGLSFEVMDKIGALLGLEIVVNQKVKGKR